MYSQRRFAASASTFARLWCCNSCLPTLEYVSFLFLFVLQTLGANLGMRSASSLLHCTKLCPHTTDNTNSYIYQNEGTCVSAAAVEFLYKRERSICENTLCLVRQPSLRFGQNFSAEKREETSAVAPGAGSCEKVSKTWEMAGTPSHAHLHKAFSRSLKPQRAYLFSHVIAIF